MPSCHRHTWEIAEGPCSDCGLAFCSSCLFYVTSEQDEPMCVPCALSKAGVRRAREPRITRKQKRKIAETQRRVERELERIAAMEAAEARPETEGMADAAAEPSWVSLDSTTWDVRPA